MYQDVLRRIESIGLIPIVVIDDPAKAIPLSHALLEAGVEVMEVTMRTDCALEVIGLLNREVPQILLGAGTVFSLEGAKEALDRGAQFIVSPHLDEEILSYCVRNDVLCCPGVFTPTEVQRVIEVAMRSEGVSRVSELPLLIKIFPASTGGPAHIKALKAVFPEVRFLPLGGINAGNLADYIRAGAWGIGGTWVCNRELVAAGNFTRITELAKEALRIISEARKCL